MNEFSAYDDLGEDDDAAWSCDSCPVKFLSVLTIGVAVAALIANLLL